MSFSRENDFSAMFEVLADAIVVEAKGGQMLLVASCWLTSIHHLQMPTSP